MVVPITGGVLVALSVVWMVRSFVFRRSTAGMVGALLLLIFAACIFFVFPVGVVEGGLKVGVVLLPIVLAVVNGLASKRWYTQKLNWLFNLLLILNVLLSLALPFIMLWKGFGWWGWIAGIAAVVVLILSAIAFVLSELEEEEDY